MRSKGDKFTYRNESDEPGPLCVRLLTTLQNIQRGKVEDTFGWNEEVKPAEGFLHEQTGEAQNGGHKKQRSISDVNNLHI